MVNTTAALGAYASHDLSIMMQTSSGDVINLDFSNEKSFAYASQRNESGEKSAMKLSSMQSFSFSIETNGIDEQDKKEIEAFMEIARPYIDKFLKELQSDAPKSPINKIARQITDVFSDMQKADQNRINYTKNSIVRMFDEALEATKTTQEAFENLFVSTQKLLEKTLALFDDPSRAVYA